MTSTLLCYLSYETSWNIGIDCYRARIKEHLKPLGESFFLGREKPQHIIKLFAAFYAFGEALHMRVNRSSWWHCVSEDTLGGLHLTLANSAEKYIFETEEKRDNQPLKKKKVAHKNLFHIVEDYFTHKLCQPVSASSVWGDKLLPGGTRALSQHLLSD